MSPNAVTSQPWSAHHEVEDRCVRIGLPTFTCEMDGAPINPNWEHASPLGEASMKKLVTSRRFAMALAPVRDLWNEEDAPESAEVLPGWTAVPLPIVSRRRRTGYLCVLVLTPGANEGEHFQSLCQSAEVDTEVASRSIEQAIRFSPKGAAGVAELIRWTLRDRIELSGAEQALDGFSQQLAESYEEIDLLYRIGRSMKEFVSSIDFIQHLCDQIHETMPYRWIAARFLRTGAVSSRIAGRSFISGDAESLEKAEQDHLAEICAIADKPEVDMLVLQPTGTEVIYRPIERDGHVVGVLVAGEKVGPDTSASSVDMKLLDGATRLAEVAILNSALYEEQQKLFLGSTYDYSTYIR